MKRRTRVLNKLLRWYNAFNRITQVSIENFRFCSYLCSVCLENGCYNAHYRIFKFLETMTAKLQYRRHDDMKHTHSTRLLNSQNGIFLCTGPILLLLRRRCRRRFGRLFSTLNIFSGRFEIEWSFPRQNPDVLVSTLQHLKFSHFPWRECCE